MSENKQSKPAETTHRIRGFSLYVGRLLVAFLLGFVPMWLKSRERSSSLAEAERELSLVRMENSLASAAIDARRGDYETARRAASDFFTSLRAEFNRDVDSALSQADIASLQPLLTRRDEIVTLLARGDTASADLLADLYVSYRELVNHSEATGTHSWEARCYRIETLAKALWWWALHNRQSAAGPGESSNKSIFEYTVQEGTNET